MNTWVTGLPEGRPTLFLALLAGALTPNKQENEGSRVLPSAGPERPNRPAQDQRRKHRGMRGDREGSHQPRTRTASHYFRPETNDKRANHRQLSPFKPQPSEPAFWVWGRGGRTGLRGLGSILQTRRSVPGSGAPPLRGSRHRPSFHTGRRPRHEGRWRPPSNCATSPGHRPGPAPS